MQKAGVCSGKRLWVNSPYSATPHSNVRSTTPLGQPPQSTLATRLSTCARQSASRRGGRLSTIFIVSTLTVVTRLIRSMM